MSPASAASSFRTLRVEAVVDTDEVPRFLVHDRDSIFGAAFRKRVRGLGVRALVTPPRSPQANAFCERVIGTLRRGCTDHVLFRDEHHAERVLREYASYDDGRPHRGLHMQAPDAARHLAPFRPRAGTQLTRPRSSRAFIIAGALDKPVGADAANRTAA